MGMDKSESTELGAATKRPSARRASADAEAPAPAADGTNKQSKRVHARRPSQADHPDVEIVEPPAQDPAVNPSEVDRLSAPRAGVTEGELPVSPAARARARRSKARNPTHDVRQPPPTAAAAVRPQPPAAPASDVRALRPNEPQPVVSSEAPVSARLVTGPAPALVEDAPPALDHADFADDFGLDVEYESKLRPWLESLCERHFHVTIEGIENVPASGRALLVVSHSRAPVWDGIVLRCALRQRHPVGRELRWLVDDQQFHAPFLGTVVNRLGAVRACQENAERLLTREQLLAVFPEGAKAAQRPYEDRYRLTRFGRGGYVKLALRTGAPVIPVAIVATEDESAVWRNRLASATRFLGAPLAALRPGFPSIGRLAAPPLSCRMRIVIGAPIAEISRQDASATHDDGLVHELNECVRGAVQHLVNASLHA
jgi:hypothetical protein